MDYCWNRRKKKSIKSEDLSYKVLTYWENCGYKSPVYLSVDEQELLSEEIYETIFKKQHRGKDSSLPCFSLLLSKDEIPKYEIRTGYFVGVDWIVKNEKALYVAPKLNSGSEQIDYIRMWFSALRHGEISSKVHELFEIKWDHPPIEIEQKQDLLTPFLIVEFLSLLKIIVRKGLKNSYYQTESNLQGKVKGKILVGKTIRHNHTQNKLEHTYCRFDEFGPDNRENRLLKKVLEFVKRYLSSYREMGSLGDLQSTFNYICPAFEYVSNDVDVHEIRRVKENVFYKEYTRAFYLAKLILRRFGYNISNTVKDKINTPPFWIDMSKLFELFVLGLLKNRFGKEVLFQLTVGSGNELDFLIKTPNYKMVIDAKYKAYWKSGVDHIDVRQISGYTRLKEVYNQLDVESDKIIDGLIVYPDQEDGFSNFGAHDILEYRAELKDYNRIFRLGVKLPTVK